MSTLALLGGTPVRTAGFPQRPSFGEEEVEALRKAVYSGRWTSAPYVFGGDLTPSTTHTFAAKWAAYHDSQYGVATGSGTDALQLAYAAVGLGPGDEAIMPPNIFIAAATPALHLGAVPIFVDLDPDTLSMSPEALEAAITPRTRLIVPLHMGGYPADIDAIMAIGKKHGIPVVADACHAQGTVWRGKKIASYSDASCFSMQQDKQVTCGEGGVVTTNSKEIADLCYMFNNDGRGLGEQASQFVVQGWDFRMSEFQGAVALAQFDRMQERIDRKNANAARLAKGLKDAGGGIEWPPEDERIGQQSYVYPRLRYRPEAFGGLPASRFGEAMRAEGLPCAAAGGWLLYRAPLFVEKRFIHEAPKRVDYASMHFPVTEAISQNWLSMPQDVLLAEPKAVDDFAEAVTKIRANLGDLL